VSSKNLILAFFLIILILAAYKFSNLYYFERFIYKVKPDTTGVYIIDRVTRITNFCAFDVYNDRDKCWKMRDLR